MFRWVKNRVAAHAVIAAIFLLPLLVVLIGADRGSLTLGVARSWLDRLENVTVDYRAKNLRQAPVDPHIVFLAIDAASAANSANEPVDPSGDATYQAMHAQGYPFPRSVYAAVTQKLLDAGARVVGFDLLLLVAHPEDDILRAALDRYRGRVVLGMNFSDDSGEGSFSLKQPSVTVLATTDPADERLGYINYWPDLDNVVREAQYRTNAEHINQVAGEESQPKLYSLAARMVQLALPSFPVPSDLDSRSIRFVNPRKFPAHSLDLIFVPAHWQGEFQNGAYFHDKIVLVGPQGDWSKDQLLTPLGVMNGAEIHLNAMNALLTNSFLHRAPEPLLLLLPIIATMLSFSLAFAFPQIAARFFVALAFFLLYLGFIIAAYIGPGWLVPMVIPLSVFIGITGSGYIYDFVLAQIEKLLLRTTFERYTSPNVARYLLDNSESYREMLAGTRKPVTVLFSDVRDFTTISEQSDSHELVAKLNEYLTGMVDCVFRHDGSLDKFIGDAVMAVWGNTPYNFGPKGDAVRAVRAALDMLAELRRLNARWRERGLTEWRIGIGLNHGEVIVGDIGSQQQKEFAVLGDAVNLASRLEGLTKEYRLEILVGESLAALVRDDFYLQTVDLVQVKGKTVPVETFTVLGDRATPLAAERRAFLEAYEAAIRDFRGRDFAAAVQGFRRARELDPSSHLAETYLESAEGFLAQAPDPDWTGVRVMTKK